MRKCKCFYCKIEFDRDKEPFEQISERRYAHKSCADQHRIQKTQNEQDYDALINYIEKLLGNNAINIKIAKQIKDYREQYGYTYSGILGTLIYWFEIQGGSAELANGGIGIVPYKYEEAKKYYQAINNANILNKDIKNHQTKYIEITIEAPKQEPKKIKLFNLGEEDNG